MILESDYAILENLAEWELFGKIYPKNDHGNFISNVSDLINYIYCGECKASKDQVKEKLKVKKYEFIFVWSNNNNFSFSPGMNVHSQSNVNYTEEKRMNAKLWRLPVNAITINKTIQELYDLGKWCGLWQ